MLHLIALAALACPPSHDGYITRVTPDGPCLTVEPTPEGPYTFGVTTSCGPGRLHGPTGALTCDGCAVDVRVDATASVTIDVSSLAEDTRIDLAYTFTPDAGADEVLSVTALGPAVYECPEPGPLDSADTADTGADTPDTEKAGGCDHRGGTPSLALLMALGMLRRRV